MEEQIEQNLSDKVTWLFWLAFKTLVLLAVLIGTGISMVKYVIAQLHW